MLAFAAQLIERANNTPDNKQVTMTGIMEARQPAATWQSSYVSKVVQCKATWEIWTVNSVHRKFKNEATRLQYYKDTGLVKKRNKTSNKTYRNKKWYKEYESEMKKQKYYAKKEWLTVHQYREQYNLKKPLTPNERSQCQSSEH